MLTNLKFALTFVPRALGCTGIFVGRWTFFHLGNQDENFPYEHKPKSVLLAFNALTVLTRVQSCTKFLGTLM